MANIAVALIEALSQRKVNGSSGGIVTRVIAHGAGWTVADVVCTSGPQDKPFQEQHDRYALAIVMTGTFSYRCPTGREVMTPGSLMLGNPGHCFECAHEHGHGDRCVSFWYDADYFERLAADAGVRRRPVGFTASRLPPLRSLSPLVTRAWSGALEMQNVPWEELAIALASNSLRLASSVPSTGLRPARNAEAPVMRVVREIDDDPAGKQSLDDLARRARLSPYHFLRTFEHITGVTPHQYVLRTRLRHAAMRLLAAPDKVLEVALDCGFGDVSNFNRAFRAEFGMNPRAFRTS